MPFIVAPERSGTIDPLRLAAAGESGVAAAAMAIVGACAPFGHAPFGPWADARERASEMAGVGTLEIPGGRVRVVEVTRTRLMDEIGFGTIGLPALADDRWPWSTDDMVAAFNRRMGCGVVVVID